MAPHTLMIFKSKIPLFIIVMGRGMVLKFKSKSIESSGENPLSFNNFESSHVKIDATCLRTSAAVLPTESKQQSKTITLQSLTLSILGS